MSLRLLRRAHLWLGCLFAPLLIFFAISGMFQTLGLDGWLQKGKSMDDLNATQRAIVHMTRGHTAHRSGYVGESGKREYRPFAWNETDSKRLPYSIFIALMALGLAATTALGIVMAYRFGGSARIVTILLVTGILIPILLFKLRATG